MQGRNLFEYAVIRIVPQVEREEFMNVGVILYCAAQKFLQCRWQLNEDRITAFSHEPDIAQLQANLEAFEQICNGSPASGPIGKLDMVSRFRWLTATRSTVVQVSKVHPGFCTEARQDLEKLFTEMVL